MGVPIYFVSLITRDNRPLHIQKFSPYEQQQYPDTQTQVQAQKSPNAEEIPSTTQNTDHADPASSSTESNIKDNAQTGEDTELPILPSFIDEKNANELLKYNFLSNMALDIFSSIFYEPSSIDQNCALLFVQDGISVYGYETNTGLKIVIGTATRGEKFGKQLDGIFKNIHKAYLRLICNPFQPLDENSLISSKRLEKSIIEVVEVWNSQQ